MQAFKLGTKQKNSQPLKFCGLRDDQNRVPDKYANIVNKSSSSKIFDANQESVQEGMCRQLNLEQSKL